MRIILITQNEPFYLSENLNTFIKRLPVEHNVVGAVVTSASPFAKRKLLKKALKTKKVFWIRLFYTTPSFHL